MLRTAVDVMRLIGNGFYGVDLKQRGKDVVIIEVNDNPSVDAGVEDKFLGQPCMINSPPNFCVVSN